MAADLPLTMKALKYVLCPVQLILISIDVTDDGRYEKPEVHSIVEAHLPTLRENDVLVHSLYLLSKCTNNRANCMPVQIKVKACGVCGTDLHIHEGEFIARFPLIPGTLPYRPLFLEGTMLKNVSRPRNSRRGRGPRPQCHGLRSRRQGCR